MLVGVPPGSQPDTVARLLGQKFAEAWGKPVVIDNVTGAAGNIAADRLASYLKLQDELAFLARQQDQRAQIEEKRRGRIGAKALRQHLKSKRG